MTEKGSGLRLPREQGVPLARVNLERRSKKAHAIIDAFVFQLYDRVSSRAEHHSPIASARCAFVAI
jgi:hypothetical protein